MAYRLALAWGILDVETWRDSVDPKLFDRWMIYESVEPWGEERADLRNGVLISAVDRLANGENAKSEPAQFVLKFNAKKKKEKKQTIQSAEQQLANFRRIMAARYEGMRNGIR